MPISADSKNKRVASSSPATNQTPRQQGETGEDRYIHLVDWTLSVAASEKKKKKEEEEEEKKKKKTTQRSTYNFWQQQFHATKKPGTSTREENCVN